MTARTRRLKLVTTHSLEAIEEDCNEWVYARCSCGWLSYANTVGRHSIAEWHQHAGTADE